MRVRNFNGRACLVVGGSKGIGKALAQQLVGRGADVAVVARSRSTLEHALISLNASRTSKHQRINIHCADVTDAAQTNSVIAEVVVSLGRSPEVVFICSGVCRPFAFEDITLAMAQATMAANFFGVWNVVRSVLPVMRAKGGIIVPTASLAGFVGLYGYTDYAASKFAVVGFAESLRNELAGTGVRVAILCPPDTLTPGLVEEQKTRPPETQAISSGARLLSADEVASYALRSLGTRAFTIIPGRAARVTHWIKRILPGLVMVNLDTTVCKVQRQLAARVSSNAP